MESERTEPPASRASGTDGCTVEWDGAMKPNAELPVLSVCGPTLIPPAREIGKWAFASAASTPIALSVDKIART